ncbi:MAG: efflux RND transporter periplasmic adaptor subunit [Planctomycetaceae bacterium]|nr:efflux RND transporter periplasmic adaptor subunit [Planctomycetaceae bacterium]
MHAHSLSLARQSASLRRRSGVSWFGMLFLLALLTAAGAGGYYYYTTQQATQQTPANLLTYVVSQGPFRHIVTERGEVESSSNIEVRCEVQSRNTAGTAILEIVAEGTEVKQGDLLCRLDASALKDEASQQQIVCNASEAMVIQAQNTLNTAEITKKEYLDGTFKQEEQIILGEISVAEENLRRAQDFARHSEKLAAKGYVTALQLEADKFSIEKERIVLETAQTKLKVLREYTKAKMLSQLEADIKTAVANLKSQESTHALDLEKLELVKAQIAKCEILAPADGQVVYANSSERRGGSEIVIEEGAMVRERQVIIRLPDPRKMQVKAKINESRIDRVRDGQQATVRLDAFPEREMHGTVRKVDAYPLAGSWFNSSVKEYGTYIDIHDPPPGMRPGMTAEVKIKVEQLPDALQVPVQAVVEHGSEHFCLLPTATGLEARKIKIGSTNEKFVIIKDGLAASESVVINPRNYLDRVELPEIVEPKLRPEDVVVNTANGEGKSPGAKSEGGLARADAGQPGDGRPRASREGAGGMAGMDPSMIAQMSIQRMDKNGDSLLTEDELPEEMRGTFAANDKNGDKQLDTEELTAAIAKRLNRQGGAPPGPGGASQAAAPSGGGAGL